MFKIITHPNSILRKKSKDFKLSELNNWQAFFQEFTKTMNEKDGAGLAAPQIGININIIALSKKISDTKNDIILINPKITYMARKKVIFEEGCLSVPNFFAEIERPDKIHVVAYTQDGKKLKIKAKGIFSRVLQHEIDHINGILFIDYLKK